MLCERKRKKKEESDRTVIEEDDEKERSTIGKKRKRVLKIEEKDHDKIVSTKVIRYIGETGRTGYKRGKERLGGLSRQRPT